MIFLPDIGTFFDKDIDKAIYTIKKLKESGVSYIKGEILHDPNICLDGAHLERYYSPSLKDFTYENYRSLIERKVVSLEEYERVFKHCRDENIGLALSVYDSVGISFAIDIGADILKVASSNITHKVLVEEIARSGKRILIDTGHSSTEEIARAINWLVDEGCSNFTVMHSPPAPPALVDQHNLKYMVNLGNVFGCEYGLSDHHNGNEMLVAAVALGAGVVEKGVTLDRNKDDQDVYHAMTIDEVEPVLKWLGNVEKGLGNGYRNLRRDRDKYLSRMGLIASRDLAAGEKLVLDDISNAFPVVGVPAEHVDLVLGASMRSPVAKGSVIKWSNLLLND